MLGLAIRAAWTIRAAGCTPRRHANASSRCTVIDFFPRSTSLTKLWLAPISSWDKPWDCLLSLIASPIASSSVILQPLKRGKWSPLRLENTMLYRVCLMCCYEARVVGLFIQLCNPGRTVHPATPNGSTEFPKMTTPEIGAVQPEHYAAWNKCSERIPEDGLKYYLLLGCREWWWWGESSSTS